MKSCDQNTEKKSFCGPQNKEKPPKEQAFFLVPEL